MTPTDPSPPPVADPDQLPKHTTPTWEVELLISGVAVFAMLQLPGWLDDRYFALFPRFDSDWAQMLVLTYMYLKSAAVILAVTFALHLSLRAHWIALVGIHSVYPDGVRWENQRTGPVQMELEKKRSGNAPAAIERADNRATIVFAIGVALATTLIMLTLLVICGFSVALICTSLTGVHLLTGWLMISCVAIVIVPMLLLQFFDRYFGERLRPDGAPRRWMTRLLGLYGYIGFGRRSDLMGVLSSHASNGVRRVLLFALFGGLILAVVFQLNTLQSPMQLGSYQLLPDAAGGARSIGSAHYDDQRDVVHDAAVPYVPSLVIAGPYLQLMVPYRPTRDTPALQQACPAALAANDATLHTTAMLECLTRIHAVKLDGAPLATLHYDVASDPRTQRPALQAMIDVRTLASGRHELRVMRAPPDALHRDQNDQSVEDVIPFWH